MATPAALQPTLATTLWPAGAGVPPLVRNVGLAIAGSLFVAVCAQVQIPLWPVPITGQTFAVLLVGLVFGWRLGAATLALYLVEGAVGLPVFAEFASGPAVLTGATGGYIVGFILAAGTIGWLAQRGWDRGPLTTALTMLVGNVVIYVPGLAWLTSFYAGPGAQYVASAGAETAFGAAIAAGLVPFLIGDAIKLVLAAALVPAAWRLLANRRAS